MAPRGLHSLELRNINYFLMVAESGSLRAAARTLGVTQPALTKAIRRLEDEAGVSFFERRSRGVSLTAYGNSFLRHARALKASMAEAHNDIEALRRGTSGLIRIGAGPSWQTRVLPDAVPRFRAERPDVQVRIHGGLDDALKAGLRSGTLDLVVAALPEPHEDPDLDSRSLMVDEYRVIAARSHPLHRKPGPDLADLLDFPWILPGPATYLARRLEVIMRARGLPPPAPVVETDIVALKLALMRDSLYLSFHAIDHLHALDEQDIVPLPIGEAGWRRRAGVITRQGIEPNAATRRLIEIIENVCQGSPISDPGTHAGARRGGSMAITTRRLDS